MSQVPSFCSEFHCLGELLCISSKATLAQTQIIWTLSLCRPFNLDQPRLDRFNTGLIGLTRTIVPLLKSISKGFNCIKICCVVI